MVDLIAQSPCEGLLPVDAGGVTLAEAAPDFITSIMPHDGKRAALNTALKAAHGMALPADGRTSGRAALRAVWTGRGQYFLIGEAAADASLAEMASLSDQSDGWALLTLEGDAAADVLARICPLDLRDGSFKRGDTARSEVAHMMAVVTRSARGFEIMVMRSFARTAVHHIIGAMRSVAAQAAG